MLHDGGGRWRGPGRPGGSGALRSGRGLALTLALALAPAAPGCATMRHNAPSPDLRPCTDGYAYTADGWRLKTRAMTFIRRSGVHDSGRPHAIGRPTP